MVYKQRSLEGVLGGSPLGEGVTGRLALDPSTTSLRLSAQNDTRGFHVYDDRARLKAGGCLPLPVYVGLDPSTTSLRLSAQDDTFRSLPNYYFIMKHAVFSLF